MKLQAIMFLSFIVCCKTLSLSDSRAPVVQPSSPEKITVDDSVQTIYKSSMGAILIDTLNANWQRWRAIKPSSYSYVLEISGFTPDRGIYHFTCRDSAFAVTSLDGEPIAQRQVPAIEDLFEKASLSLKDAKIETVIQFNAQYSYPQLLSLAWGESLSYKVTKFTVESGVRK